MSCSSTYAFKIYIYVLVAAQANDRGNGFLSENVKCQNIASQIQGDENDIALSADQSFPEVEEEK
jgi:hypothetical protein